MSKLIFSITPNPSLDLSGTVNSLHQNEKSYVTAELRSPGGNAINVARVLDRLGVPVLATGFLGGHIGQEVKKLLDLEGVKNKFIQIEGPTRINVTISNNRDHQQTRLSFPGPEIQKLEIQRLFKMFEVSKNIKLLTIGGSLPIGFAFKHVKKFIRLAQQRNIPTVIDCPGQILKQIISAQPLMIKPNLEEFHQLTGTQAKTIAAVENEARKLLNLVPYICVSSVEKGTLLVTKGGSYFGRIPRIKIKSTVGAGDSMVGAMIAQLFAGNFSGAELLRWGLAGSAATLGQPGTTLGGKVQIHQFLKKVQVTKL